MLESILLAAGYTVGCYSTPHLIHYNERVRLNGSAISNELLTASFSKIDKARKQTSLSYFEFGTLAALDIFADQRVDIQILEVGLGGRLDAVNIIDADAALITSIALDHVDWLGDDIAVIALEKAGIFRAHQKAVCSDKTVPSSLLEFADQLGTSLILAGVDFNYELNESNWYLAANHKWSGVYPNPALRGNHQIHNAAGVVSLLAQMDGKIPVNKKAIEYGLKQVSLTGRLQVVSTAPLVLLDVAHNAESALALADFVKQQQCTGKVHAVFSILADKDLENVLEPFLGVVDDWYIAPLNANRAQASGYISHKLTKTLEQECHQYQSIADAFNQAKYAANNADLVICFGSFYVVEACLEAL